MSGTPLSPTDFMSKVGNEGGISTRNKFSIMVSTPQDMPLKNLSTAAQMVCHTIQLPGKSFSRTEDRIYGIDVQKPYGVTFEPVTLAFYNTNNFNARLFWETWLEWIQPTGSRNIRYYSKMIGQIQIYHYSEDIESPVPGKENYVMTLNEAYPMSIEEVELGWDNQDVMDFQVQISYKDWSQPKVSTAGARAGTATRDTGGSRQGSARDF